MDYEVLAGDFRKTFGRLPSRTYFSPGRVNLIGEHIDYNGGRVMPAAISAGHYFAMSQNGTDRVNIHSTLFGERKSMELPALSTLRPGGEWVDYITGTLLQMQGLTGRLAGVDVLIDSDLPQNSGLSSSAALCVGFGYALSDLLGNELDKVRLALAAKAVENDYVGVNCGIMDQFAVAMGKAGHCILLDCDTLDYELLPLDLAGFEIVITNSRVVRKLTGSNYNMRRSECEQALEILKRYYPVDQLCQLSAGEVDACAGLRGHETLQKRARHAASENDRVNRSALALKQGRLADFGALMNASHESMRDDFEASCKEVDFLVEIAQSLPGVLGSRITGGGFGGCTVSIVDTDAVPGFIDRISSKYAAATPYEAGFLRCRAGDGVKRLEAQEQRCLND